MRFSQTALNTVLTPEKNLCRGPRTLSTSFYTSPAARRWQLRAFTAREAVEVKKEHCTVHTQKTKTAKI